MVSEPTANEQQSGEDQHQHECERHGNLDPARSTVLSHVCAVFRNILFVVKSNCPANRIPFPQMPKLWDQTIEAHRRAVHNAALAATGALVAERGLRAVTMSEVAQLTGIGRATLYKYFPDVETMLAAWHERQVRGHLDQLGAVVATEGNAAERLTAVLRVFARLSTERHGEGLVTLLHRGPHIGKAQLELRELVRQLVAEGAAAGDIRDDVPPDELADYCLHAVVAARAPGSKAAVERLVTVILAGLRQPTQASPVGLSS
jgi:AcrR family transcriptional regulator